MNFITCITRSVDGKKGEELAVLLLLQIERNLSDATFYLFFNRSLSISIIRITEILPN